MKHLSTLLLTVYAFEANARYSVDSENDCSIDCIPNDESSWGFLFVMLSVMAAFVIFAEKNIKKERIKRQLLLDRDFYSFQIERYKATTDSYLESYNRCIEWELEKQADTAYSEYRKYKLELDIATRQLKETEDKLFELL
jgi:hypothetical protein